MVATNEPSIKRLVADDILRIRLPPRRRLHRVKHKRYHTHTHVKAKPHLWVRPVFLPINKVPVCVGWCVLMWHSSSARPRGTPSLPSCLPHPADSSIPRVLKHLKNCANSQLSCALKKTIRNARAILLSLPGSNQRHYLFPLNKVAAVRILMADDITEIRDDKRKTDFLFVGSIEKKADVIGAKLSFDTEVTCPLFFQLIKKPKNPRAHFLLYMKNKIERASFSHANRYTTIALLFFILPVGH